MGGQRLDPGPGSDGGLIPRVEGEANVQNGGRPSAALPRLAGPGVNNGTLRVLDLGIVPYAEAVDLQLRLVADRIAGLIPDTLLLLEHPRVITCGRGTRPGNILADAETLARRGVEVHETGRGGDVTYHGPGQLVGYPVFDLEGHGRDVHRFLRQLEASLIGALEEWGVRAHPVEGLTGVWVGNDKIAAIGIGLKRWVTWHGFALNVNTDLRDFELIVPCGLDGRGVTSMARLLGEEVPLALVRARVGEAFRARFGFSRVI